MSRLISLSTLRPLVAPDATIGQIVKYTGDMANASGMGAVVAIREGKYISGGRAYDVALTDGREFLCTYLDESRWQVSAQIAEPEHLTVLRAGIAARKATDAAKATSAAAEFERIKAQIKADNPHLTADSTKGGDLIQAAKNIRTELKRAFPSIKFSVTTERFSGGNSLDICWTDGPTSEQVEKITGKYSGAHFDGMTDCYEYSRSPWVDVFGSAKYVSTRREYSDKMVASVVGRVCRQYGGLDTLPTVEDYRQGRTFSLMNSGGCDMGRAIGQALQRHTYSIAKA